MNNDPENGKNPESDPLNLKLDPTDPGVIRAALNEEKTPIEETVNKTARLAKINLLLTILGLGGLGYLQYSNKATTDEAIAKSKASLKKEIASDLKSGLATSEQLNNVLEKNAELDVKLDGYATQISSLESKTDQLSSELQKTNSLRTKISELETSMKKSKAAVKPAPAKSTKAAPAKKPVSKSRKK